MDLIIIIHGVLDRQFNITMLFSVILKVYKYTIIEVIIMIALETMAIRHSAN